MSNTAQKLVTFSAIGSVMMMAARKGWYRNVTNAIRTATGNA